MTHTHKPPSSALCAERTRVCGPEVCWRMEEDGVMTH